jgi:hypothetical protein
MSELLLAEHLDLTLGPLGFKRRAAQPGGLPLVAAWTRKTWNTNRGVALVERARFAAADLRALVGQLKAPVGTQLGYFPFFYGLGLQLVVVGRGPVEELAVLQGLVDTVDSQTVVLQSLHVVDLDARVARSARTWGQVITGRFIDAVEAALRGFVGGAPPRRAG